MLTIAVFMLQIQRYVNLNFRKNYQIPQELQTNKVKLCKSNVEKNIKNSELENSKNRKLNPICNQSKLEVGNKIYSKSESLKDSELSKQKKKSHVEFIKTENEKIQMKNETTSLKKNTEKSSKAKETKKPKVVKPISEDMIIDPNALLNIDNWDQNQITSFLIKRNILFKY